MVIIDEVHAYDTYMSTILDRVLEWLGAHAIPVVLLSATLPACRRTGLITAWRRGAGVPTGPDGVESSPAYPLVTWATARQVGTVEPARTVDRPRVVELEPRVGMGDAELADWLVGRAAGGACVAVVRNTVARAQALRRELAKRKTSAEVTLFHARFPHGRRLQIEAGIISAFGRAGRRPGKGAIVVATQVIEQSLDIDFDVMVSDLAPVDLLLQRIGRLWRHDDRVRPDSVDVARLLVTGIDGMSPVRFPDGSVWVYGADVLTRSWYAIRDRREISLPADIRNRPISGN